MTDNLLVMMNLVEKRPRELCPSFHDSGEVEPPGHFDIF